MKTGIQSRLYGRSMRFINQNIFDLPLTMKGLGWLSPIDEEILDNGPFSHYRHDDATDREEASFETYLWKLNL